MAVTTQETKKKKRPPTFQHLPRNSAVKLKKQWVEKKKLKSKWRAQKRKEGFLDSHPSSTGFQSHAEETVDDVDDVTEKRSREEQTVGDDNESSEGTNTPNENEEAVPKKTLREERSQKMSWKGKTQQTPGDALKPNASEETEKPSLRELTRAAYSRSSLHNLKSDPLRKRNEAASSSRSNADVKHRQSQFGSEGRKGGRGQPNMKLRMGALLERIKRDHS